MSQAAATGTALGGTTDGAGSGDGGAATAGGAGANAGAGQGTGSGAASAGASGAGDAGKSWRDALPEDIRTNAAITSFQDVGSLAKSFIHAQSAIGKKGVIVPGEKATDAEWSSFFQGIGVPPADKYEVAAPKDYALPEPVMKQFKEQAAKNGLLPKQAAGILDWYAKFEKDAVAAKTTAEATAQTARLEALKKEWGEGYTKEANAAFFAVKEIGGPELVEYMKAHPSVGNDPMLIKAFSKVAKLFGEDKLREGGVISDGMTPSEINLALSELRANGDTNGLFDKTHPMHSVTLAKMENLAKRLTGGR